MRNKDTQAGYTKGKLDSGKIVPRVPNDFFVIIFLTNKDLYHHSDREKEILAELFELHSEMDDINLETTKGTMESLKELLVFNSLLKVPSYVITNYLSETKDKKNGTYFGV